MLLGLIALLLPACSSTPKPSGHLVIVGGGLKADNAAIHTRFVELCTEGPIGIVPTASGDGLEAGEEVAARWRKWAGQREVVVIPLTQFDADKASDPAIITQIDSCGGLWFTGGDQSRIVAVFRPDGKDTPAMQAVRRVLDKGGVIGGTSAGAAMMSDPMITGGRSPSHRNADPDNPGSDGVRFGRGLGLFPYGITDQHFIERGRLGRLLFALGRTHTRVGFGVSENCAMVVDLRTDMIEAMGDHAVCIATRSLHKERSGNIRLDVLSSSDRVDGASGTVHPRPGATDQRVQTCVDLERKDTDNFWAADAFLPALKSLCVSTSAQRVLDDGAVTLTLKSDGLTRVLMVPGETTWPCMIDVLLRVELNAAGSHR